MKKVLMLATTAAMIEQFNKRNMELLNELGYTVDVAGNFEQGNPISTERLEQFKGWIEQRGGIYYNLTFVRNPLALQSNCNAYRRLVHLLTSQQYEFVHVHTPVGSIFGRIAAHKVGVPIIYTAHGFHFYRGAPLKNWLLYYPAEWLCSWWTDVLITINQEDYERAKKHLHAKKVRYVPGVGVDTKMIGALPIDRRRKRAELGITEYDVVLLSVGELNRNKNHQAIIEAIHRLKDDRLHYVICGRGELEDELGHLARRYGLEKQIHVLGFRTDVMEWYQAADIYAFPSMREGLSVALMEAMAAGLPVICSEIRGNTDLVDRNKGGYLILNSQAELYATAIRALASSEELRGKMSQYNLNKIRQYDSAIVNEQMQRIYRKTAV